MYIRAPRPGYVRLKSFDDEVDEGHLLYQIDKESEDIEVLKAETALALLRAVRARREAVAGEKLVKVLAASAKRARSSQQAYHDLLKLRQLEWEVGAANSIVVEQAKAFKAMSFHEFLATKGEGASLGTSFDEIAELLPLQEHYAELALEAANTALRCLEFRAPARCLVNRFITSDTWVSAGTILAELRRM